MKFIAFIDSIFPSHFFNLAEWREPTPIVKVKEVPLKPIDVHRLWFWFYYES